MLYTQRSLRLFCSIYLTKRSRLQQGSCFSWAFSRHLHSVGARLRREWLVLKPTRYPARLSIVVLGLLSCIPCLSLFSLDLQPFILPCTRLPLHADRDLLSSSDRPSIEITSVNSPPLHAASPGPERTATYRVLKVNTSTSACHDLTMHSPRSASAMRPSSPLSPRFDSSARYQPRQPQSSRPFNPRGSTTQQRRQHGSHLALPGLPRFHPANFPSAHSSVANTPGSGPTSPQAPISPQMQQNLYAEAQRQALLYQQELMSRPASRGSIRQKPDSPRLAPLGSPGPVTPLELEEEDNYLAAGSRTSAAAAAAAAAASAPRTYAASQGHSDELTVKLGQVARQSERPSRSSFGSSTST